MVGHAHGEFVPWCVPDEGDPGNSLSNPATASFAAPFDVYRSLNGVENAWDLARRYLRWGIDVVMSDVLNADTATLYRSLIPGILIVQLLLPLAEARRRASFRPVYLTEDEFDALHASQSDDLAPDHVLDVESLTPGEQSDAVAALWKAAG